MRNYWMSMGVILIGVLFFCVGCDTKEETNGNENQQGLIEEQQVGNQEQLNLLNEQIEEDVLDSAVIETQEIGGNTREYNISDIVNDNEYSLEISNMDGEFYKASEYFASRVLEILANNTTPEWKDSTINNHQIILKFEGYDSIYINTDFETYWFEGEDEIFSADGIQELWDRYVIKLVNDEPVYYGFEKSILSKTREDLNGDGERDDIILYYDGNIFLKINEEELLVSKGLYFMDYLYGMGEMYGNRLPQESAKLEYIDSLGLLMYTFEYVTMSGPASHVVFYTYDGDSINKLWSSIDLDCDLEAMDYDNGIATLSFPFANKNYELVLEDDELQLGQSIKLELENAGITVDEEYINNQDENIYCWGYDLSFEDYDRDGDLEMLLYGTLETVGAIMPLNVYKQILIVFELNTDRIECSDIVIGYDD